MRSFFRDYWGLLIILLLIILSVFNSNLRDFSRTLEPVNEIHVSGELHTSDRDINNQDESEYRQNYSPILRDPQWENPNLETGNTPKGFRFKNRVDGKVDNYLQISVGWNTDVVVKLMKVNGNECIRYIYVRGGDTYKIKHIPPSQYYLKIAYGKNWRQKIDNGQIVGKFATNALYKISTDVLDYEIIYLNKEEKADGFVQHLNIPSYSVSLDVTTSDLMNNLQTNSISEEEFNK